MAIGIVHVAQLRVERRIAELRLGVYGPGIEPPADQADIPGGGLSFYDVLAPIARPERRED